MHMNSKVWARALSAGAALLIATTVYAHSGGGPNGGACKQLNPGENCCQVANSTSPWKNNGDVTTCEGTDVGGFFTRGNARARYASGVEARVTTQGGCGSVVGKAWCERANGTKYFTYTAGVSDINKPQYRHCLTSAGETRLGYGCHIESACSYD